MGRGGRGQRANQRSKQRYPRSHGIEASLKALQDALADKDATAAAMAAGLAKKVAAELDRIERSVILKDDAQADAVRKQLARLCNTLMPWRKPQERVYTVFSFLFEHGFGLIPRLIRELDIESFAMNEVIL